MLLSAGAEPAVHGDDPGDLEAAVLQRPANLGEGAPGLEEGVDVVAPQLDGAEKPAWEARRILSSSGTGWIVLLFRQYWKRGMRKLRRGEANRFGQATWR